MAIRSDLIAAFPSLTIEARQATSLLLENGETLKFARGQTRAVDMSALVELPETSQFIYQLPERSTIMDYLLRLPNTAPRPVDPPPPPAPAPEPPPPSIQDVEAEIFRLSVEVVRLRAAVGASVVVNKVFNQLTPAATWVISHDFGRLPSVAVYDDSGEEMIADVQATLTAVSITFANATAGSAILT